MNKLVRKILVSGVSWSERTYSGMVKEQELWKKFECFYL